MTSDNSPKNYNSSLPLSKIIDERNKVNQELGKTQETKKLIELGKKLKPIGIKAELAENILKLNQSINDNNELLESESDQDLVAMLKEENTKNLDVINKNQQELITLLAPSDDKDDNEIYIEIRAGAGGDEAGIFVGDVLKMYTGMCANLGLNLKVVDLSQNEVGGYKEIIAEIRGSGNLGGAYSWLKYEGGVHRVQRVPATEKQGRIHTSTVSVAIMPIVDSNSDFKLDLADVEIVASTSQGAGGQSVNTTYSAIQVHHKPTGIRAQCQDERNQAQNKIKALDMLTSRVFAHYEEIRLAKEYAERKDQVGRADRSEKIRTYNYPQDRITDHRYNISSNNLPGIMTGGILDMIKNIKQIEGEKAIMGY
jgi:peptide chain release factor 1